MLWSRDTGSILTTTLSPERSGSFVRSGEEGKGSGATSQKGHRQCLSQLCSSSRLRPFSPSVDKPLCLWRMASATPDLQLPSQLAPIPIYTAWLQRHMCVPAQLVEGCTWKYGCRELNPRPVDCRSSALTTALLSQTSGERERSPWYNRVHLLEPGTLHVCCFNSRATRLERERSPWEVTRCRSLSVTHLWQWRSSAHIWRLFCFAKHIVLSIAPSWQFRL